MLDEMTFKDPFIYKVLFFYIFGDSKLYTDFLRVLKNYSWQEKGLQISIDHISCLLFRFNQVIYYWDFSFDNNDLIA